VNAYQRTVRRLGKTTAMRWTLSKVLTPLDMALRNTRFAPSRFGLGAPLCFLTTSGRRSGEPRTVPLLYVPLDEDALAVAATNYGQDDHPGWSYNLESEPRAQLEIDGVTRRVIGRLANEHESAHVWPRFDAIWPAYETYRNIAPRDIKVFILEPEFVSD
jgi:deazaflavin-dependent oxidoreductase (nitroreductase family)